MKFKESFKKPLATFFIFILGIFAVSGLSYITIVTGAAPGTTPENGQNTFIPINTGSTAQGRCKANNTANPITLSNFYSVCQSGNDGLDGSSTLITNGFFVKNPNTVFQITGAPGTSYKYGALYAGCTNDSDLISDSTIRDRCGNTAPSNQPPASLYGNITMLDLIDQNQVGEKPLCISAGGTNKPPKGQVMVCP